MDNICPDRVLAFDSLFTTNHIQMFKILLGYVEPSMQGKLAVYIKFLEFQYTLQLIRDHPSISVTPAQSNHNMTALLDEILPLCSPADRDKIQGLKNMFQTMENMQEMMQMMEMLQEISPELFQGGSVVGGMGAAQDADGGNSSGGGMDFMQLLNMLQGTDLSQMSDMMNMMQGMFGGDETNI